MGEIVKSNLTGKDYDISKVVRLLNIKQSMMYIKNGCKLLDLYVSLDNDTNEPILVFIFDRKESKEYFDRWCKHELN